MDTIDRMLNMIERGLQGLNVGLSLGLPRLEAIMDGIQRQTYTIIAGGTGSGKTTLCLYSYVYRPIMDNFGDMRFRVVYFSLEMKAEILLAKILSLYLFEQHGVILSYKEIMSRQGILPADMYKLIQESIPWLREFTKQLKIYDRPMSAKDIGETINEYALEHGLLGQTETSIVYTPHVKDELVVIAVDHLGLLKLEGSSQKKPEMDKCSKELMTWRNICGYSPLVLLQLNRGSSSMDRLKEQRQEIELSDIKDTSGPSEDAEIIMALYHPHREKRGQHLHYDIKKLKDRYRAIQILKSRLGEADKTVGVNFFGEIGFWRELPRSEDMKHMNDIEIEPYLTLRPSGRGLLWDQPDENAIPPQHKDEEEGKAVKLFSFKL